MIISEQEAKVIAELARGAWNDGCTIDGDTILMRKLLVYYPSLESKIGFELMMEEKYRDTE